MIGIVFYCACAVSEFEKQELISGEFFSESCIGFSSNGMDTAGDIREIYDRLNSFELRTPRDPEDSENFVFAVLSKNFKPSFRIKNGRYFKNSDFFVGSYVAVVGADAAETLVFAKDDGKDYVRIFEKDYLVIGTIKRYQNSDINSAVFYNLDSVPVYIGDLVIDARSQQDISLAQSSLSSAGLINSYSERVSLERLTGLGRRLRNILLISAAVAVILGLLRALISFLDNRDRLAAKYLFGVRCAELTGSAVIRAAAELAAGLAVFTAFSAVTGRIAAMLLTFAHVCPAVVFSLAGEALLVSEYLRRRRTVRR